MSCNCSKPSKSSIWTSNNVGSRSQSSPQLGENVDCYAKRALGEDEQKATDVDTKPNEIANTVLTSDLEGHVDTKFELTLNSDRVATTWEFKVGFKTLSAVFPELSINTSTGMITGTISSDKVNKNYKVLVTAKDSAQSIIDSKEYNFFPKIGSKEDTIQFIMPFTPSPKVFSLFGNRDPKNCPKGASIHHQGIDITFNHGKTLGKILAAADGIVTAAAPSSGFGNRILIEHFDTQNKLVATTCYGHMKNYYVKVGDKVRQGQVIAEEGNLGSKDPNKPYGFHLHFEIHKGKYKNPVDPIPYILGDVQGFKIIVNGENDPRSYFSKSNSKVGLTSKEVNNVNSVNTPTHNLFDDSSKNECPENLPLKETPTNGIIPTVQNLSQDQNIVKNKIKEVLDTDPSLDEDDKKLILFTAKIESNYNPSIKNNTTSAYGLFQMTDKTAEECFRKTGNVLPPPSDPRNHQMRSDIEMATKAQIHYYKFAKTTWQGYVSSGKTKVLGRALNPSVSASLATLSKDEFIYGKIHHDGIGNTINGTDKQGVDYYRKQVKEYNA